MRDICKNPIFIKGAVCALLFLLPALSNAQALEGIVNAEKAFAQTSIDKNTRAAFLEFFDDKTLAFNNGQPTFGRRDWEKRSEGNGYLFWWPVYADVAASGDFGYTTGPAVFGPDKATKEAKGGLYYSSVWKKNADGQWKVVADMGSATYNPSENLITFKTTSKPSKSSTNDGRSNLQAREDAYNKQPDASYFSTEGRMHRRGVAPVISQASIKNYTETQKYSFEHVGKELASSNDMAFTYGLAKGGPAQACYMRVWKLEEGEWKIVLDVIGG